MIFEKISLCLYNLFCNMNYRIEHDFLGEKAIPANAYWGVHTQRALENFPISGIKNHPDFIKAIAQIKAAVAKLCVNYNVFEEKLAKAIIKASQEIFDGSLINQIVVDVFQAGAGTSLNMNVNEVIANRANELLGNSLGSYNPVHPNDAVNFAQSTNDVIPTAMRISTIELIKNLLKEGELLAWSFNKKAKEFKNLIKSGRTHLTDATPIRLGDEFLAYGICIEKDLSTIKKVMTNLYYIGLSGSATGSGVNVPDFYKENIVDYLSKETGLSLKKAKSLYEAMQNQADFAHLMGALNSFSLNLFRITSDLRLLSSGPNTGLNEIKLPEVQAGSSIMPGKINPSILEMFGMVCFYVSGMNQTVSMAVSAGQLELNVFMPIIANSTLTAIEYLTNAISVLRKKCIEGIEANKEVMEKYALTSLALPTVLSPKLGYEKTADLVKEARRKNEDIIKLLENKKVMTRKELLSFIKNHFKE